MVTAAVTVVLRTGQAVQQPQHHTGGSHQAPHHHHQRLLVSLVGLAHTHMVPSPQEHPHAFPRSSPPHCAGTGKVRKAQRWLKHSKNERSALEEQHLLLTVTVRALELNKGDWDLAQAHVLVCTRVFSILPGLSLFQGIAEAMAGPMAVEPSFSAIPVSLPGGDTPDPLQARLPNIY